MEDLRESILSILMPKYRYFIDTYFLRYFAPPSRTQNFPWSRKFFRGLPSREDEHPLAPSIAASLIWCHLNSDYRISFWVSAYCCCVPPVAKGAPSHPKCKSNFKFVFSIKMYLRSNKSEYLFYIFLIMSLASLMSSALLQI